METLTIGIVGGGCAGIDPATLRRVIEAAHAGGDVLLSVNKDGVLIERMLEPHEKDLLIDATKSMNERVSFSVRSKGIRYDENGEELLEYERAAYDVDGKLNEHTLLVYEPDRKIAVMGGCGIGGLAEYAFRRATQYINPRKLEPFHGKQRKQIPPRRIHARGCSKRNGR